MRQTNQKIQNFDNSTKSFFDYKKILMIIFGFVCSVTLIVLSIVFVLKINFNDLWSTMGDAFANSTWWVLILLILFMFVRPMLYVIPVVLRLREHKRHPGMAQCILFGFTIAFLYAVTPANWVADPYTLFWMKSNGINNKDAYCITITNAMMYELAQIIITIPSFIVICEHYNGFVNYGGTGSFIFWLMVIGLVANIVVFIFYSFICLSKKVTYYMSYWFNSVKKLLRMDYHTKEQCYDTYYVKGLATVESIRLLKRHKHTFLIFLNFFFTELFIYIWIFFSVEWIAADVSLNWKDFANIFNCGNVAITTTKIIPIPGNALALESALNITFQVCGGSIYPTFDQDKVLFQQSILIYRFFSMYLPLVIGIFAFAGLCIIQYKNVKAHTNTNINTNNVLPSSEISNELQIQINKKEKIPALVYGDINKAKNVFVHLNIANATKSVSKFWKLPKFKKSCICILDLPGHGDCKIKSSIRLSYYLRYIAKAINSIKKDHKNIKKVYLSGESFGANLAIMYGQNYSYNINGVIAIHPPLKIRNPKKGENDQNADGTFKLSVKYIWTLLTGINTHSNPKGIEQLTSNLAFLRMCKIINSNSKQDTKVNLAVWFSMSKARRDLKKHFKRDEKPKFYILQSKKEFYYPKNKKYIDKLSAIAKNKKNCKILTFKNGDHILTIDPIWQNQVWSVFKKLDK